MGLRPVIGGYPRSSPTLAEAVSGSLGPLFSRIRPKSPFLAFRAGFGKSLPERPPGRSWGLLGPSRGPLSRRRSRGACASLRHRTRQLARLLVGRSSISPLSGSSRRCASGASPSTAISLFQRGGEGGGSPPAWPAEIGVLRARAPARVTSIGSSIGWGCDAHHERGAMRTTKGVRCAPRKGCDAHHQ
jgi:hypothetical protein